MFTVEDGYTYINFQGVEVRNEDNEETAGYGSGSCNGRYGFCIQSPVTVEMRDGTAEITLEIVAAFGARIPAVAEKVQENVKSAVQNMTNVTVSRVDLVIAGLAPAAEPQA